MKKNKYKVTRKDIENSPINYSFTEVAIKNMANRHSAYNINKLQQENKQLKEQLAQFTDYISRLGFNNFNDFEEWMGTFLLTPHEEQTLIKDLKEQLAIMEKALELALLELYYIYKEYCIGTPPSQEEYVKYKTKYFIEQAKESMK